MKNYFSQRIVSGIQLEMNPAAKVIDTLHEMGYAANFELVGNRLRCQQTGTFFDLKDIAVDEIYQFHDEVLNGYYVYAIHDRWNGFKGLFTALLSDPIRFSSSLSL